MRYARGTSNYPKRIILSDPTYMMSIADLVAIGIETLRIDCWFSIETNFTELIHMNP